MTAIATMPSFSGAAGTRPASRRPSVMRAQRRQERRDAFAGRRVDVREREDERRDREQPVDRLGAAHRPARARGSRPAGRAGSANQVRPSATSGRARWRRRRAAMLTGAISAQSAGLEAVAARPGCPAPGASTSSAWVALRMPMPIMNSRLTASKADRIGGVSYPICVTCGVQYGGSVSSCPVCEDPRQYVPVSGQAWTSLEALRGSHSNEIRDDHGRARDRDDAEVRHRAARAARRRRALGLHHAARRRRPPRASARCARSRSRTRTTTRPWSSGRGRSTARCCCTRPTASG